MLRKEILMINQNAAVGDRCKPTLALDFDGVLHWYRHGWKGVDVIDDIPVPGAVERVKEYLNYFEIVVFSSRSSYPGGIEAMKNWMCEHGFPIEEIHFATTKPAAFLTIDDRAYRFDGVFPVPQELLDMKPWNR